MPPEDLLLAAELCAGMAARYQPQLTSSTGAKRPNKNFKEHRYAFWLDRWVDALAKAAPYYAPKLMAMAVQQQVLIEDKRGQSDPREVMLEIYLEMLRRGELTDKVLDARQKKINGPSPERVEDAVIVEESDDDDGDGELA